MGFQLKTLSLSEWNRQKLKQILTRNRKRKILVIGDVGIDRYTQGLVERVSPEAPVPIVWVQEEKLKLGLAANVADNIRALGGTPYLIGIVGHDRAAEDFKKILKKSEISSKYLIVDPSRRTVLKERVVSERQQLLRIDYETPGTISPLVQKRILAQVEKLLSEVDGIVIEDYAKGMFTQSLLARIFRIASDHGKLTAVDPNIRTPWEHYHGASILTPNTKEAEHLAGVSIRDSNSLAEAGFRILERSGAQYIVITRGKEGMALFEKENRTIRLIPTYAREVYDVSGAGDTVISVLIMSLLSGAEIEEAAVLGNLAAGIEVGKRGTATVSPEEIRSEIEECAVRV